MSNRTFTIALQDVILKSENSDVLSRFHHIVLTAPDIDAEVLKTLASKSGTLASVLHCTDQLPIFQTNFPRIS